MAGNTLEGLLTIPPQTRPGSGSLYAKPKQVEAWLTNLPMANIGESARQIYSALREMNRLIIPPADRFRSLEALRQPLHVISEALKKHYIRQTLPLSPKNKKIAELAIQLNSEMAMGYKSVIEDTLSSSFSRLKMKSVTVSIHRAIHYLSNVLLCAYQIYIHHPENTWLELNRLYLFAEENGIHDKPVHDDLADSDEERSIEDDYKRILLLALANPYGLRQHITESVFQALGAWARHCRILPYSLCGNGEGCTSINLNSDAAPGFFCEDGGANPVFCRNIDTGEMNRLISGGILGGTGEDYAIPEEVLKRLLLIWGGRARRQFSRSASNNEITITLGLSATHHYIDEVLRPQRMGARSLCSGTIEHINVQPVLGSPDDSMELDAPALYTSTPVFGISNLDDHTPDVWDPDYTYRASNPTYQMTPSEEDDRRRKEALFTPVDCRGVNESAGGYCLLGRLEYDKDSRRVQVGELVGLHDNGEAPTQFSIGIIRRIKSWNNGLELGIQKLAPCAEAIATAAVPREGESKKYNRSLVLPELTGINQPATLITHAWHREGDEIITNIHGQKARVRLARMLENTGVFAQFEFRVLDNEGPRRERETPSSREDEGFDDVWSIL